MADPPKPAADTSQPEREEDKAKPTAKPDIQPQQKDFTEKPEAARRTPSEIMEEVAKRQRQLDASMAKARSRIGGRPLRTSTSTVTPERGSILDGLSRLGNFFVDVLTKAPKPIQEPDTKPKQQTDKQPESSETRTKWRALKTRIVAADSAVHTWFASRFPRTLPFVEWLLEWVYEVLTTGAFQVIAGLIAAVVLLVKPNLITLIIAVAWFITALWIARSGFVKNLTIGARVLTVIFFSFFFGSVFYAFGNWAMKEYRQQAVRSDPVAGPTFRENIKEVRCLLGPLIIVPEQISDNEYACLRFESYRPFKFKKRGDRLLVDAVIYGFDGTTNAEVKENEITIRDDLNWDLNRSETALEIVDEAKNPVLQIIYQRSGHVRINGIFPMGNGQYVLIANSTMTQGPIGSPLPPEAEQMHRLFKYPSWRYRGEYER